MQETISATDVPASMIDVAGTPVALRRKGTGPPLVFLHGAGFTGQWLQFYEELSHAAEVIAPEHIGFGETPFQEWLNGFDDLVLHYEDFRKELGLERLDLVGYSLGGWIAAEYATVYPERVNKLVLITPAGLRVSGQPIADLFTMTGEETFGALFNDPTNIPLVAPDVTDPRVLVHLYEESATLARLVWNPRYDPKLKRRLRRISCPTLVVGAEHDRVVPDAMCDLYTENIAGSTLVRIPGTGHALIVEQPSKVAKAVLDFLGGVR